MFQGSPKKRGQFVQSARGSRGRDAAACPPDRDALRTCSHRTAALYTRNAAPAVRHAPSAEVPTANAQHTKARARRQHAPRAPRRQSAGVVAYRVQPEALLEQRSARRAAVASAAARAPSITVVTSGKIPHAAGTCSAGWESVAQVRSTTEPCPPNCCSCSPCLCSDAPLFLLLFGLWPPLLLRW